MIDPAIIAGLATLKGHPVAVIATEKGTTLEERMATHFGSPEPAGYRKSLRVMRMAEKMHMPIDHTNKLPHCELIHRTCDITQFRTWRDYYGKT